MSSTDLDKRVQAFMQPMESVSGEIYATMYLRIRRLFENAGGAGAGADIKPCPGGCGTTIMAHAASCCSCAVPTCLGCRRPLATSHLGPVRYWECRHCRYAVPVRAIVRGEVLRGW